MFQRIVGWPSPIFGLLAATTAYLVSLLFGYVFGVGTVRRHHIESASYVFAAVALVAAFVRSKGSFSDSIDRGKREPAWLPAVFIAAAAILYGNTVVLGMFSDDFVLAEKALAGEWFPQESLIRPAPLIAWRLLLAPARSPAVLHLFNICLHGLNAALVALLAARVGLSPAGSIAAGVFFLVFPSSVEAVVWPAAVHDLIVTACALAFLLLASQPVTATRLTAAMLVLILGLLSKESAIVIPLLAIVLWLDFARARRTPGLSILLGGLVVCAVYTAFRMAFGAVPDSYAHAPTRYLVKEVLARPVATFALPWTTAVFSSWPVIPFLWVLTCILVIALYVWSRNRSTHPEVIVRCLAAALFAVLPLYSILFITPDLENGRYLYLSTAFWVVALVGMAVVPRRVNRVSLFVFTIVVAVSVVGVQVHLAPWREAARVRERVLAAARDVLETTPCAAVTLGGAPDTVRGAFVFRNGLSEAISSSTRAVPAAASGEIGCHFRWNGSTFEKTSNLSVAAQAILAPVH